MPERYDPFGRPIEGDHPWARPSGQDAGLPGGFLPPESPSPAPAPIAAPAPAAAPERPATTGWTPVGPDGRPAAGARAPLKTGAPAGVEFASWGSRVGASLIDLVIEAVLVFIVAIVAAAAFSGNSAIGAAAIVLSFVVIALYSTTLLAVWDGQTVGKRAVGIRVVGEGGAPLTWGRAALREIVMRIIVITLLGTITFGVAGFLDVFWPLWDKENRSLHDHGADTWVVRR